MTKIIQRVRAVADVMNAYVGPEGEITATTDSNELRLHDGATAGGFRFLHKLVNDMLYQKRNTELDALSELDQERGFLVRTGSASYLIRKIDVDANELTVQNPDGFLGNIKLGLAATIDKIITFVQTITFENGIIGSLQGDVQGDVTGNLQGNATGDHDGTFTGSVDVRGAQVLFDAGQIPLSAIAGSLALSSDPGILAAGFIAMWSGSVASIPAGWQLCDGTNGTPDLRDRFVRGAGGALNPGATGGTDVHTHGATTAAAGDHSHTITVAGHTLVAAEMPQHYHMSGIGMNDTTIPINGYDPVTGSGRFDQNNNTRSIQARTDSVGGNQPHSHAGTSAIAGSHGHTITVANGSSLPAYYALCFIMRI